jgi:type IV pilus assembly protein PilP
MKGLYERPPKGGAETAPNGPPPGMWKRRIQSRQPRLRPVHWLLIGAFFIALPGCGGSDLADLRQFVAEVKSRQKGSVQPLPEIKTVEPFVFNPTDLRDPFFLDEKSRESEETKIDSGLKPDMARPKEELESYELDSLRMVGTVTRQGTLWGLIKAADGTIHRIRTGNYLGKNYGRIVSIKENQVELVEIVPESSGSWRERKAALELTETSRGKK